MTFDAMSAEIVRLMATQEATSDSFKAVGIDYEDWPDSFPKQVATEFARMRTEGGYKFAFWKISQSLDLERLQEAAGITKLPEDPKVFIVDYQKLLHGVRVKSLTQGLIESPDQSHALIQDFLTKKTSKIKIFDAAEVYDDYQKDKAELSATGKIKVSIPNWPILSEKIGGFNPGRFGILMADSGFGKTSIALQLSVDASETIPTLFFNMEMSKYDFTHRLVASATGSTFAEMHKPNWNNEMAKSILSRKKFYYSDGKDLSLQEIESISRVYKNKKAIELIIVDYDQKIILKDSKSEEWREMHKVAVGLESLAKELNAFVLLLAQTNFDGGISSSKRIIYPASTVMVFGQDADIGTYVRTIKNRHGPRNSAVTVEYKPEANLVREKGATIWVEKKTVGFKK